MPGFDEIRELESKYVMQTYGRFPVGIESGKGAVLYGFDGREYIDFASGIGVMSLGHGDTEWVSAVSAQAKKLSHVSNLYYTEPMVRAAEMICRLSGMDKVFFANSGAEANEGAIKLARKYSFDKYGQGRSDIITLVNSFHGRTVTTLAATGQERFHSSFFPFTEGFIHTAANDMEALRVTADSGSVCAVMAELIQGEGGVLPLDRQYVSELEKFCKERDILLIIDEVQTGNGRTGAPYAFMRYGIKPDVATTAKGLGGGLPIGAVMASEKVSGVLSAGTHATTFGANPVCCAGACVVLKRLSDESFMSSVREKGELLMSLLKNAGEEKILDVCGMGLMIGVRVKPGTQGDAVKRAMENGVLCLTAGADTVRLLPPLTVSEEEIRRGAAALIKAIGGNGQ